MNGDDGDGDVGGVGNVAVRYRGARTAHPMVGGWERERDVVCVWGRRRGWWGLLCSSAVAVGVRAWLVGPWEA
eukprot:2884126-Prymnesium_polylepis.1